MRRGIPFVLAGASGSGKTTLCREAAQKHSLSYSISFTTRPMRPGEQHGRDYYFTSREAFDAMIEDGDFVEWAEVYGNRYGTSKKTILPLLEQGQDVVLDLDIKGSLNLKALVPWTALLFIVPPSMEVLTQRLRGRGTDSDEVIARRLALARQEMKSLDKFDYVIQNTDLRQSLESVSAIILAERCLIENRADLVESFTASPEIVHG